MKRLKDYTQVSYDSMIIIYYCFNFKHHRIIEFTNKAQKLTEFLINNHIQIVVPSCLISEIRRKDTMNMIEKYISSNQISNMPPNPNRIFKLGLDFRFKNKIKQILTKDWFKIEKYTPPIDLKKNIQNFFEKLIYQSIIMNF